MRTALTASTVVIVRNLVIVVFCILTALAIGRFTRTRRVREDSMIGICLVGAMAVGILLIDLRTVLGAVAPTTTFHDLLFGSIVMTTRLDVVVTVLLAAAIVVGMILLHRDVFFYTFDPEGAEVFGVRTGAVYYGLLIALVIVMTMRIVGVVLTSALLILPASTAALLSQRINVILLLSVGIGVTGTMLGMLGAIELRHVSPGAVIVLVLAAAFFVANAVSGRLRRH